MFMLDLKISEKYIFGENMHIYQIFIDIRRRKKCVNCETALTKPITLNDETVRISAR